MDEERVKSTETISKPPPYGGLLRVWHALFYSLSGLNHAVRHETAFKQEVGLGLVLTFIAVLLPISAILKLQLVSSHLIVLIVELLNTAIESIVDKASPEYHELAKQAKDMGSAAVLVACVYVLTCWGVALYQLI
jgi:diacylglycerol kinase (ATP)